MKKMGISVIIPSYNAASWLISTVEKIEIAIENSGITFANSEIIIVNDGSNDSTDQIVKTIIKNARCKVILVSQKNQGRYLARKNGVGKARYSYLWFVDTRVYVDPNSLRYVISEMNKDAKVDVWNAHVNVQKKGNIIARFMDAITFIGWRRYFKNPRRISFGTEEFDFYPKGTTSFFVPKQVFIDAMSEFEQEDRDIKYSSDDTHLIRIIARSHLINISPKFSCKYHARTSLRKFVAQAFYRGQTFVDGFLRPGTRFYRPLQLFLFISLVTVITSLLHTQIIPYVLILLLCLWVSGFAAALLLGLNKKDALSLFALSPIFAVAYGSGLWIAVSKKVLRKALKPDMKPNIIASAVAIAFYSFCVSFFYLGKSTFSCGNMLATGPGDQTGLIWLNSTVNLPLWGSTQVTNAPYGESLQSATHILGTVEYGLYWLVAQFVGPVCGYNLFTAIGLVFSALIVFYFTKSLTRRIDVALFAGFAATFTPYLQIKTGVHPSYAFYGFIVLVIWIALKQWRTPTVKKAIFLGLAISLLFFIDPYFILLGGVAIIAMFTTYALRICYLLVSARKNRSLLRLTIKRAFQFLKLSVITASVVVGCALIPLLGVRYFYGSQIDSEVGSVRSDIKTEAFTYSVRPSEYLLPSLQNPYIGDIASQLPLPDILTRKPHGSNPAEDNVSISLLVMALALVTLTAVLITRYNRKFLAKSKLSWVHYFFPIVMLSIVGFAALVTSFPPKSDGFIWPSDIITDHITIWRVFGRLAVIVAFAAAIIAAIGLAVLTMRFKKKVRLGIVAIAILVVAFEYLTFVPLNDNRAWSYNQVHPFYTWLKDQKNIQTIAEYPLNEPGLTSVSVAYFRDQYVHKKPFINAFRAASPQAPLRNGIRDISDPQTAAALSYMGVDLVIVHAEDKKSIRAIKGLEVLDWNNSDKDPDSIYVDGKMWVFKVTAQKDKDGHILVPGEGFERLARINSTYTEAGYVLKKNAKLSITDLDTGTASNPKGKYKISFKAYSSDNPVLSIIQNGKEIWRTTVGEKYIEQAIVIDGQIPIEVEKIGGNGSDGIIITDIDMKKLGE